MQMTGQAMWKSQDKLHIKTLCYIKLTLRFSLLLTVPPKDFFKNSFIFWSAIVYRIFFFKVAHRQSAKHIITFYCNTWDDSRPFLAKYISFTASSFLLAHLLKKKKNQRKARCLNITLRHLALVFSFIVFFSLSFYGGVIFSWSSLLGLRGLTKWFSCSLKIKHKCSDYFE